MMASSALWPDIAEIFHPVTGLEELWWSGGESLYTHSVPLFQTDDKIGHKHFCAWNDLNYAHNYSVSMARAPRSK